MTTNLDRLVTALWVAVIGSTATFLAFPGTFSGWAAVVIPAWGLAGFGASATL